MDRSRLLGEEKIGKLLLKFSIPAIIGMIVNALYNIIDRIFIGQGVGSDGITGITVGFPIMLIIMAFGMLVGIGATALISIRLGENKKEEAEKILGNSIVLLVLIAIIITTFGLIFLDPLLTLFGASEEALPLARDYLRIILIGSIFQCIGFGMNGFIRGEGNPMIAMLTMVIGAVANIILDPIFIFVLDMGIAGAALATITAQAISSIWVLYYFFGGKSLLNIHKKNFRLDWSVVLRIFAIGSAPFSMQLAASGVTAIFNIQLGNFGGDTAIAAFGIINSIAMLILMPIFGINQGSQPIIGYNYGAKQYDRVKKTLLLAILAATGIVLIGFVIVELFSTGLISMFNSKDAELIRIGSQGMRIFLIMLPIIGFQIVSSNYFQAVGKAARAMFLSLSRQVLFLIPAILILPRFFELQGLWMAGPLADLLSSVLTGAFLIYELRHLDSKHQEVLS
ncbi:MATE family efflux transporter [Vallitalea okinawensis]|uniref:MATE family efflux transporter n=1 Tax=Vallitalea okinawensis TaxID=2078660 RepID=UPI000CFDAF49|nr:MATE family efflux transporter [Vallitalea okinawensis]